MKALYHTSCSKTIKHTCIRKLKEIITLYSLKKSSTILQRQQEHAHTSKFPNADIHLSVSGLIIIDFIRRKYILHHY